MKLKILATVTFLASVSLIAPAQAEMVQEQEAPGTEATPTSEQVLQACAQDQAQTLPSPYTDVPQDHWAYKAVLSMYYCGAYRGQIPPEQFQRRLQEQRRSNQV